MDLTKEEEKIFIENMEVADDVYMAVVNEIGISSEDIGYKNAIFRLLREQTKDFIVSEIWKNLSNEQIDHLADFLKQNSKTRSWMKHSDAIMDFAQLYPDLLRRIFPKLSDFFKNFISEYRNIENTG